MSKNKIIKKLAFHGIFLLSCFIFLPSIGMSSDNNTIKKNETDSTFVFENIVKDVPDGLAEQVKLYWQYQGSKNLKPAYEIEAPHTKYQIPFETYVNYHHRARKLNGCKILNVDNSSGRADVRINIEFDTKEKTSRVPSKTQVINDLWIELNGKWYHVYINPFANIQ